MSVTLYPASNFQDNLTLNMPGGTGTGTGTWTVNQDISGLPATFPFKLLVYTSGSENGTHEIVQVSAKNNGTKQLTISVRADESTTAIDHPNGSVLAQVPTAELENNQNQAIADLQLSGGTALITAAEAWSATTPVTNAGVNQAYSLPTLLYESGSGQWSRMSGATAASGARFRVAMAYEASSGSGASVRVYIPGSVITVASMSAELSRNFSSSGTTGACETTVRPPYYTFIGFLANATTFVFTGPVLNNTDYKGIFTPVTSGEAFSVRDLLYIKASDGRAYRTTADGAETGLCYTPVFAAQAATGAAQVVSAYTPGAYISGFSGLTVGAPYYPSSTLGAITTTRGIFGRVIGYATSATELLFAPGKDSENTDIQFVKAGENWTGGDLLYQKRSDGRYYKADRDTAESGILQNPAIAVTTHTGGAGSNQSAFLPGSIIFGYFNFSVGWPIYPASVAGAYSDDGSLNLDLFYRVVGFRYNDFGALCFQFFPQEMQFLPPGIQEKGYVSGGGLSDTPASSGNGIGSLCHTPIQFRKIMSNTPASLTITTIASSNCVVTVQDISRFGAALRVNKNGSGNVEYYYHGTYQTVGN